MPDAQPASPTPPRRRRRKAFLILLVALAVAGGIWWWNHPRPLRFLAEFDALSHPLVCDAGFVLQDRAGHFTYRDWNGNMGWQIQEDQPSWAGWKGMDYDTKEQLHFGIFTTISDDGSLFYTTVIDGNSTWVRCWQQGKEKWEVTLPIHPGSSSILANEVYLAQYRCSARRLAIEIGISPSTARPSSRMYVIEDGKIIACGAFPGIYLWAPDLSGASAQSSLKSDFYTVSVRGGKLQLHKCWTIPGNYDIPEPVAGGLAYRQQVNMLYDAHGLRKRGGGKWQFGGYSPDQQCLLQCAGSSFRSFTPATMRGWSVRVWNEQVRGAVSDKGRYMALTYKYRYPIPDAMLQMLYPKLGGRLVDWYNNTPVYLDVYERPGRLRARLKLDRSGKARINPRREIFTDGNLLLAPTKPRLLLDNSTLDRHIILLGW